MLDQCERLIGAIKKVCIIHISAKENDKEKPFLNSGLTPKQVATESGIMLKVLGFFDNTTPLCSCLYSTVDDLICIIKANINKERIKKVKKIKRDRIMTTRKNGSDKIIANSAEKERIVAEAFCIMVVQFATDPDNRNCLDLDALINNSLNKATNEVQVISLLKSYYHDKNNANSDKRYIDLIGDIFDEHKR